MSERDCMEPAVWWSKLACRALLGLFVQDLGIASYTLVNLVGVKEGLGLARYM